VSPQNGVHASLVDFFDNQVPPEWRAERARRRDPRNIKHDARAEPETRTLTECRRLLLARPVLIDVMR